MKFRQRLLPFNKAALVLGTSLSPLRQTVFIFWFKKMNSDACNMLMKASRVLDFMYKIVIFLNTSWIYRIVIFYIAGFMRKKVDV